MKRLPQTIQNLHKCKKRGVKVIYDKATSLIYLYGTWISEKEFNRRCRLYFRRPYLKWVKRFDDERCVSKNLIRQGKFELLNKRVGNANVWDWD